jgi:two-component system response regulator MtrA
MLVEDDESLRAIMEEWLTEKGYEVIGVGDGLKVVETFKATNPELVLMDIQLPGRNGLDLVRDISEFSQVPIIVVTASIEIDNMEKAYEAGAVDYVEKSPWQPDKWEVRIRNHIRQWKATETDAATIKIGAVTIDIVGHEVRKNGEKISLTPLEFKLLTTLAAKPKEVFSREQLLKDVWDYPYQGDTRLVNVHIQRLRSKIEDDPDNPTVVVTVRGIGYKAGPN